VHHVYQLAVHIPLYFSKVAWEHRQLKQLRKMSLLRHEHIVEGRMQHHHYHCHQITDLKMNNWIPEITQEDA
jgi:hypothetical protein